MDTPRRNRKIQLKTSFIIVLIVFIGSSMVQKELYQTISFSENISNNKEQSVKPQALGEGVLHDKVHTFHEDQRQIEIHVYFLKGFNYWINSAVVTDGHSCHMNITLIDPIGRVYYIYKSEELMTFDKYYPVPFGVVVEGNYTLHFTETEGPNLNVHIRVEQDFSLDGDLFVITKGKPVNYTMDLKSDIMYHIELTRISPIAYSLDWTFKFDLNLTDPSNIVFTIYNQVPIIAIYNSITFPFGTAQEGIYYMTFSTTQAQLYINLAIQILVNKTFTDEIDSGNPNNETHNHSSSFPYIPSSFFYSSVGIIGIIAFVSLTIGIYYRRKFNN
ncbi:MAG: hypothetical protein JXA99_10540 [Candidatus Lokiarchaeota archaeon]|nr:hypothetical protein [Candidatus Lokiarchaeota archaeon]